MNEKLKQYLESREDGPKELHFESSSRCNGACVTCVDGETKILMANFLWKPIKKIKVGDKVVGFQRGSGNNEQTKIINTIVTAIMDREVTSRLKLTTSRGEIICTPTHSFVDTKHKSRYKEAKNFKKNQEIKFLSEPLSPPVFNKMYKLGYIIGCIDGDGCLYHEKRKDMIDKNPLRFQLAMKDMEPLNRFIEFVKAYNIKTSNLTDHCVGKNIKWSKLKRIRIVRKEEIKKISKLSVEWHKNSNFYKGYLAAFFDSDGCLSKRGLHFCKTNKKLIDRICEAINYFKFKYTIDIRNTNKYAPKGKTYKDCYVIRINGGISENVRFFSLTNPAIERKREYLFLATREKAIIENNVILGKGKVYNISTESGNYIANGIFSKNCPREGMTRYQGEMSHSLFVKGIMETKEAGWQLDYVHFHLNGEPLYLPIDELVWRIDFARENLPSPILCFFTNASLLTEGVSNKLLKSQLDKIVFSVDGGNKEAFERCRPGLKWETVTDNIRQFMELKRAVGSKIATQTAIIPHKGNNASLPEYYKVFNAMGIDDVGGSGVQNIGGLIDSDSMILPEQYQGGNPKSPCWRIFNDLSICADGKAVVCCQCVRADEVVGDLNTMTLPEIWRSERFKFIRECHIKMEQEKIPFCSRCDYMRSFCLDDNLKDWWPK